MCIQCDAMYGRRNPSPLKLRKTQRGTESPSVGESAEKGAGGRFEKNGITKSDSPGGESKGVINAVGGIQRTIRLEAQ